MISEWIICPICGNKTRDRVMEDSRHACGLVLDNGMELLLHIGIDTVEMQGDGFEYLIKEGQEVKAGDLMLEFDIEAIKAAGLEIISPVVVCNTPDYKEVKVEAGKHVKVLDEAMTLVK